MAHAVEDKFGMLALTADTEIELATLDVRYQYRFEHLGVDAGGVDDSDSAKSAWLSGVTGVTGDKSVEDEKFELADGKTAVIGPGISKLFIVSSSGADGVIQFVRIGSPTPSY